MTLAADCDTRACPSTEEDTALSILARTLATSGYEVRHQEDESSRYLTVAGPPGLRCEVTAPGSGDPLLDCCARDPRPGPHQVVAAVLSLLADPAGQQPSPAQHQAPSAQHPARSAERPSPSVQHPPRHGGLLPTAGRSLRQAGLAVRLSVDADQQGCEPYAELAVTNPAQPQRGTVMVDDDGGVLWRCPPATGSSTRQAATRAAGLLVRALAQYRPPSPQTPGGQVP